MSGSPVPDYSQSWAILIGTSQYADPSFPALPAVTNSLRGMRDSLTDPTLCGWPADRVLVWENPADVRRLVRDLRRLTRTTPQVLLVYFAGHGTITPRGQLCMILGDTDADDADITGLEFDRVREAVLDSPADTKIVILDCCYSGRAIQALASSATVADSTDTRGVYTLTASDHTAHVAALDQQTATATSFTGEFLDLIHTGIPGAPERLTLSDLYLHLRHRLQARGLPAPNQRGTDTADRYAFTRNAAAVPAALPEVTPSAASSASALQDQVGDVDPPVPQRPAGFAPDEAKITPVVQPSPVSMRLARGIRHHPRFATGLRMAAVAVGVLVTLAADNLLLPHAGHGAFITSIGFSPDGKTIATSGNAGVRLWDVATGRSRRFPSRLPPSGQPSGPVIFSTDGRTLFTPSTGYPPTGVVQSRDVATGQVTRTFLASSSGVYNASGVALSPDGKTLAASVQRDDTHVDILLWEVATGHQITTLTGHTQNIETMAFNPGGDILASTDNRTLRLWNLVSHKPIGQPQPRTGSIASVVAFSPDGKTLASCDSHQIQLWNAATGKATNRPFATPWTCFSLAFSPDRKSLITYGWGETDDQPAQVRTQDATTGHVIKTVTIGRRKLPLAMSPDGKTLAAGDSSIGHSEDQTGTAWLWNTTGRTIKILTGSGEEVA